MAKRGIFLLAGDYPQYGKMNRNLAMGIKKYSDIEIALFIDEKAASHLTEWDRKLFTIHHLPEFTYKTSVGNSFFRVKTLLPELTPFDETVFLDADIMWHPNRKIDDLFNLDTDFTMINEGYIDFKTGENSVARNYHFWAKPDDVRTSYNLKEGRLYQYRSEMIYFKNTDENKKYFALARQIYDNPKMQSIRFGEILPDEIAFGIASAILKKYPHKGNWSCIYWDYLYSFMRLDVKERYDQFYGYSMGGKQVKDEQRRHYNELLKFYFNEYKIRPDWEWQDKMTYSNHHQQALK